MFIAVLGSGPVGDEARDHQERCHAAVRGCLNAVANRWRPTAEDMRWWFSFAAIQFIHRRWQDDGRPAPWKQAARLLPTVEVVDQSAFHRLHRCSGRRVADVRGKPAIRVPPLLLPRPGDGHDLWGG